MKYFCLGNGIALYKSTYSNNFFDNLPIVGTPIFSKFPITQEKMRNAFECSEKLVLCKSLEDANMLRYAKLVMGSIIIPGFENIMFKKGTPGPIRDFAIYEVEINDGAEVKFHQVDIDHVSDLVTDEEVFSKHSLRFDTSALTNVEICPIRQPDLKPKLLACHYQPLIVTQGENPEARCIFNMNGKVS